LGRNHDYAAGEDWLADAAAIVLPAVGGTSAAPPAASRGGRRARDCHDACGLANVPGVTTIPTGNAVALRNAIESVFSGVGA